MLLTTKSVYFVLINSLHLVLENDQRCKLVCSCFIPPSSQSIEDVSINACGRAAVQQSPASTPLHQCPTRHTRCEWGSRFAPYSGRWYHMLLCYTCIRVPKHHLLVCAARPSLSLFVCACWRVEGEVEASSSCIYTCMSRSLLAGQQRSTPAA